jgi:hypothetical protein
MLTEFDAAAALAAFVARRQTTQGASTGRRRRTTDIMMAKAKGAAATLERKVFRASRLSKFGTVPALIKQQLALVAHKAA